LGVRYQSAGKSKWKFLFIPKLIDLYLGGRFPFDRFVSKYKFEQINQAIDDQARGKVVKPVFTFAP
jgi:aryl-alcohol dehydrogenase